MRAQGTGRLQPTVWHLKIKWKALENEPPSNEEQKNTEPKYEKISLACCTQFKQINKGNRAPVERAHD